MWWLFFPAVQAIAFPSPVATASETTTAALAPEPTSLLLDQNQHELFRRATTEQADASVCGYYDGSKNSRLACYNGANCVFHASNTAFPAMMGCCPASSTTTPCTFFSTCYNSADTSSVSQYSADPFVLLCTGEEDSYCHTRTWPDLAMRDYGCTDTDEDGDAETMYTVGSLTDYGSADPDQIFETLAINWVSDGVLAAIPGAITTTTPATTTTGSEGTSTTSGGSPETETETGSGSGGTPESNEDGKGGGTPTGTIVGAVVGSIVGVLVIVVAAVLIWRYNRKKRTEQRGAGLTNMATAPPREEERAASPPILDGPAELHGKDATERVEIMQTERDVVVREVHELQ